MHNCPKFKKAVDVELINKPSDRLPGRLVFSEKYFFQKLMPITAQYNFEYLDFCPFCGKELT